MNSLFYNSLLLFSSENMQKLQDAKISVCGIGGVGSIATEMLVRTGISNFKLADGDIYTEQNFNRQIFATLDSVGKNKALAAKERMLSINPNCNIQTYTEGVNINNIYEFCQSSDVILALNDTETTKVLIHKVAKEIGIPVIMGSRSSIDKSSRWNIKAQMWDYKNEQNLKTFGETNHPNFAKYKIEDLTPEIIQNYEKSVRLKKINTFKSFALDEKNNFFKTISKEELLEKLENNPDAYNRHVCSVIANTAGILASTLVIRYILGMKTEKLEFDLMQ